MKLKNYKNFHEIACFKNIVFFSEFLHFDALGKMVIHHFLNVDFSIFEKFWIFTKFLFFLEIACKNLENWKKNQFLISVSNLSILMLVWTHPNSSLECSKVKKGSSALFPFFFYRSSASSRRKSTKTSSRGSGPKTPTPSTSSASNRSLHSLNRLAATSCNSDAPPTEWDTSNGRFQKTWKAPHWNICIGCVEMTLMLLVGFLFF